jgi:hypothetical protein
MGTPCQGFVPMRRVFPAPRVGLYMLRAVACAFVVEPLGSYIGLNRNKGVGMAEVLGLIGAAIDTLNKLRTASEKLKDADSRMLIADLSMSLADLKIEIAALKEENLRLQQELRQKKTREAAGEMISTDGVLYFKEPPADKAPGPYCPNCKEHNNRLVLLNDQRNTPFAQLANYRCPICHSSFK